MKPHIACSPDPIYEGATMIALCGEEIPGAVFVFMADGEICGRDWQQIFTSLQMCSRCLRQSTDGRYVYGIVSGEEACSESSEPNLENVTEVIQ